MKVPWLRTSECGAQTPGALRIVALMLALLVTAVGQPQADQRESSASAQEVSGIVVDRVTGAPVSGANVTLRGMRTHATKADSEGRFKVQVPESDHFIVTASAEGYITGRAGTRSSRVADLRETDSITGLVIDLDRGSDVSGFVVDAERKPVPGARIDLVAREGRYGREYPRIVGSTTTGKAGRFAFEGVAPGEYYLRASLGEVLAAPAAIPSDRHRSAVRFAYWPSGDELLQARALHVEAGSGNDDLIIELGLPSRGRALSIRLPLAGAPVAENGLLLKLFRQEGVGRLLIQAYRMDYAREVTLCCLSPGNYAAEAYARESGAAGLYGFTEVFLDGRGDERPVAIDLMMSSPVSIRGHVTDSVGRPFGERVPLALTVEPLDRALYSTERVDAAFTSASEFEIPAVFLDTMLVHTWKLPPSHAVQSIVYRGVAAEAGVVDLRQGMGPPVLEIRLTPRAGAVSGSCATRRGDAASGVAVLLPPSQPAVMNASFARQVPLSKDGSFSFQSIPKGRYAAACVPDHERAALMEPTYLRLVYALASRVEVGEGASVNGLRLVLLNEDR